MVISRGFMHWLTIFLHKTVGARANPVSDKISPELKLWHIWRGDDSQACNCQYQYNNYTGLLIKDHSMTLTKCYCCVFKSVYYESHQAWRKLVAEGSRMLHQIVIFVTVTNDSVVTGTGHTLYSRDQQFLHVCHPPVSVTLKCNFKFTYCTLLM